MNLFSRKSFLALIGLSAAGQTTATIGRVTHQSPRHPGVRFTARGECATSGNGLTRGCAVEAGITTDKPVNGECPVCGTMAPAYFPQTGRVLTVIPPINVPAEPDSRIVRCSHCNDAFWQDAEGVK